MRSYQTRVPLLVVLLLVALAGCTSPPAVEETPTPLVTITTLPTSTSVVPTAVTGTGPLTPNDVAYDARWLTETVEGEVVPERLPGEGTPARAVAPTHLRFSLGQALSEAVIPTEGQMLIYPVPEYEALQREAGSEEVATRIARLRELIAQRPLPIEGEPPLLPPLDGQLAFHTQVAFLDFEGGAGVRYLAQAGQAPVPIGNDGLFYTFQGLSHDGQHLIVIFYPVSTTALDSAEAYARHADDPEGFGAEYEAYRTATKAQLDALSATAFEPTLDKLDTLVASLLIGIRGGGAGQVGGGGGVNAEASATSLPVPNPAGPTVVPNPTVATEGRTEVILLRPTVPTVVEQGTCAERSHALPRDGAWRCIVEGSLYDPCVVASDEQTVVCDMQPLTQSPGFAVQLTQPLPTVEPSEADAPFGWLLEFEDGTYCSFVTSITGDVAGARINHLCSDQSIVLGDLEVEGGTWYATRASVMNQQGTFEASDTQRMPVERVWQ